MRDDTIVTIYKNKGDRSDCNNYRRISLLSIVGKVYAPIILNKLQLLADHVYSESQCGFRAGRSTTDMIFFLRQLQEKSREQGQPIYMMFIDLTKAFDLVSRKGLFEVLNFTPLILLTANVYTHDEDDKILRHAGSPVGESGRQYNHNSTEYEYRSCNLTSLEGSDVWFIYQLGWTLILTHYEIPEFYQQFREEFPKLVMVTDGFLSETDDATFDVGQIIRFHICSQQRRIKAVAMEADGSQGALYSIPLDYPNPLFICEKNRLGKEKVWKPQLLKDIVENHKMPLAVQFASPDTCEDATSARISTVTLTEGFNEIFLLGNTIDDGCLSMGITAVPLKRTGMKVALLTGIKGRTIEEWVQYCTELNNAVTSCISFSFRYGPAGIRLYDLAPSSTTSSEQKPLRRISRHLSKMFSPRGSVESQKVAKERPRSLSPTNSDRSCGETNAGFQEDSQSPGLSARNISNYENDDEHVHYKCEGKTITTVTDVSDLLKRLKLEEHLLVFKERGIDGRALFKLSEQILEKEYNFKRVESVKLMTFVRSGHIPN